jgi:hypothetical protein
MSLSGRADLVNGAWFVVVLAALVVLFAAGVRVPLARAGWRRGLVRAVVILAAAALTLGANVALFRHDVHVDVTSEKAFTPSADARRVVEGLHADVDVTYFYQKPAPSPCPTRSWSRRSPRRSSGWRSRTCGSRAGSHADGS